MKPPTSYGTITGVCPVQFVVTSVVPGGQDFYNETYVQCTPTQLAGIAHHGWDNFVYELANQGNPQDTASVSVTFAGEYDDGGTGAACINATLGHTVPCFAGDFGALYWTSDPTLASGWSTVGATPAVKTGWLGIYAPHGHPLWDEQGTTLSTSTFNVTVPANGVIYLSVAALFDAQVGLALDKVCGENTPHLTYDGSEVGKDIFVPGTSYGDDPYSPGAVAISIDF
jgi:hypothetical protein